MTHDLALEPVDRSRPSRFGEYDIRGGGGVTLRAHEWGARDGPAILFVHGWSQCDMCWDAQVQSPLAERFRMVTFDNRGHGMSESRSTPAATPTSGYGRMTSPRSSNRPASSVPCSWHGRTAASSWLTTSAPTETQVSPGSTS